MNHNMDNTPQPTEQCLEKPTVNIGKLGFILSLISIPLCLIAPTSLLYHVSEPPIAVQNGRLPE